MSEQRRRGEAAATVAQLAAAMAALGFYHGENTPDEHAEEAARLGGAQAYRVRMVNALLGVIAASQDAIVQGDVETLAAQTGQLKATRAALENAINNTDVLLNMLKSVGL